MRAFLYSLVASLIVFAGCFCYVKVKGFADANAMLQTKLEKCNGRLSKCMTNIQVEDGIIKQLSDYECSSTKYQALLLLSKIEHVVYEGGKYDEYNNLLQAVLKSDCILSAVSDDISVVNKHADYNFIPKGELVSILNTRHGSMAKWNSVLSYLNISVSRHHSSSILARMMRDDRVIAAEAFLKRYSGLAKGIESIADEINTKASVLRCVYYLRGALL